MSSNRINQGRALALGVGLAAMCAAVANAALQLLATGAIIVLAAVLQSLVRRREGVTR